MNKLITKSKLLALLITLCILTVACSTTNTKESKNEQDSSVGQSSVKTTTVQDDTEQPSEETTEEMVSINYLPDFELRKIDGTTALVSDYSAKYTVINFWASWCPHCVNEIPLMDKLNQREDVKVILINVGETKDTIEEFFRGKQYTFDLFLDEDKSLFEKFQTPGLPINLVIGPNREFYAFIPSAITEEYFDELTPKIDELEAKLKESKNEGK